MHHIIPMCEMQSKMYFHFSKQNNAQETFLGRQLLLSQPDERLFCLYDPVSFGYIYIYIYIYILAVPGMRCNASRNPPSRSTSHEVR
jgi:hypothetical protein